MRTSTLVLATLTLALAASTTFLLVQRSAAARVASTAPQCSPHSGTSLSDRSADMKRLGSSVLATADEIGTQSPRARTSANRTPGEPTIDEVNVAMDVALRARQQKNLQDPAYRAARSTSERLTAWMNYRDVVPLLGLSSQQADRLLDLLAQHRIRSIDRPIVIPEGRASEDTQGLRPAWLVKRDLEEQARQAEIEALLGKAKYEQWIELRDTADSRREVATFASACEAVGDPLLPAQRDALIHAIAAVDKAQSDQDGRSGGVSMLGPRSEESTTESLKDEVARVARVNKALVEAASAHLSERQLEAYRYSLNKKLEWAKVQLDLFDATDRSEEESDAR